MKQEVKILDLTPTWSQALGMIFIGLESNNAASVELAKDSIRQMAKICDQYIDELKNSGRDPKAVDVAEKIENGTKVRMVMMSHLSDLQMALSSEQREEVDFIKTLLLKYPNTSTEIDGKKEYGEFIEKLNDEEDERLEKLRG